MPRLIDVDPAINHAARALGIEGARRFVSGSGLRPIRIQRRRVKGWQAPAGVVYVGRGSVWGNPFRVGAWYRLVESAAGLKVEVSKKQTEATFAQVTNAAIGCQLYRHWLTPGAIERARRELRGRDLMCWCGLDEPCHADILLEVANPFL